MDTRAARVTVKDGQIIFHRLIREYKERVPREKGQSAADYQQEAEAAARRGLQAELEMLALARLDALKNGLEIPKAQ